MNQQQSTLHLDQNLCLQNQLSHACSLPRNPTPTKKMIIIMMVTVLSAMRLYLNIQSLGKRIKLNSPTQQTNLKIFR